MPRGSRIVLLMLAVAAVAVRAEDLSKRLEALEREAASRPAPAEEAAPEPAAEPAEAEAPAAPAAAPAPANARLLAIQERRARDHRKRAASAAQRAARRAQEPGADVSADERERDLFAKKAEDVFRPGTAEYQAAYDEWLASEQPAP